MLRVFIKEIVFMQMEFETDRQRRDLIYDCVKLLAQAKSVPIYAKATGRGVGDNCYHVTMADKTVAAHVLATKYSTKFLGQAEFIVKVPYDIFDVESTNYVAVDAQFDEHERVAKIYARVGQLIYNE